MNIRRPFPKVLTLSAVLAALALSQSVRAESLADRAPADAVGFASWAGSDSLGKSYEGSHLKAIVDALNLPQLISQHIEEENKKEGDADKAADKLVGEEVITAMLKSPSAVYFGPVDFANADQPKFKVAIYSQLGKDKARALAEKLFPIIERTHKQKDPTVTAVVAGEFLLITVGDVPDMAKRLSGPAPADGLGSVAGYQKTMGLVGGPNAAATLYINGEAMLRTIDDGVAALATRGAEVWPKMSEAFGIRALKDIAIAGNFDGADWSSQAFVGLDAKRFGYMALLDSKRLNDDALKLIPKDAVWAGVARVDAARFMTDIRDGMAKIDPQNNGRGMDAFLHQFFAVTGVDFEKDIINQLDDAIVMYGAPDAAGHSLKNSVVAMKPKDAPKLDDSLTAVETVVSTMFGQRGGNGMAFKTDNLPPPNDKTTIHTIATPTMNPSWTVANNVLFFSLSKEGVQAAVEKMGKNGFIPENPAFAELWKKVGNKEMSAFTFVDYAKVVTELYPLLEKELANDKAQHPERPNPFTLPPLEKLTANLSPSLSVNWTDADGYHAKSVGPLPVLDMMPAISIFQVIAGATMCQAAVEERNAP